MVAQWNAVVACKFWNWPTFSFLPITPSNFDQSSKSWWVLESTFQGLFKNGITLDPSSKNHGEIKCWKTVTRLMHHPLL